MTRTIGRLVVSAAVVTAATVIGVPPALARPPRLPPPDRASIAARFDPALARFGLHVSRASLQRRPSYHPDPHGRHLAVYVQPTGRYSDADYVRNTTRVARVFLPQVFRRWADLQSFDVCQEPLPSVDPNPEAPPVTQLVVTKKGATRLNWADATLAQIVRASNAQHGASQLGFHLYVDANLQASAAYGHAAPPAQP